MKFIPSKYQQDIFDFVQTGTGNAVVNAVAGSGKSTTLLQAVKLIPQDQSILQLAFNKSIVAVLKEKIGRTPNVQVKTLHSLGCQAVMANHPCQVKPYKYANYINTHFIAGNFKPVRDLDIAQMAEYRTNIARLVDLIRANLIRDWKEAKELAEMHGLFLLDNELRIVNLAIKWGRADLSQIDFVDMIYLPCVLKMKMPTFDWVFIDECQDLNKAQRELFLRCLKKDGSSRFLAVGDPMQAIYGFAGADADSFKALTDLPGTATFALSICYRCSAAIVALVKGLVPNIECSATAAQGEVQQDVPSSEVRDGDAVLCRLTSPLVSMCMTYLTRGVKAFIKGRDIGKNLIGMITKTKQTDIDKALKVCEKELIKLASKVMQAKNCSMIEALESATCERYQDQLSALDTLGEGLEKCTELIERIQSIFSDKNIEGICLSTVHKSKGLEFDRVFILEQDSFYHARAMASEWMAQQEANIVYVAYTRAKHYLGFLQKTEKEENEA